MCDDHRSCGLFMYSCRLRQYAGIRHNTLYGLRGADSQYLRIMEPEKTLDIDRYTLDCLHHTVYLQYGVLLKL